jgi:hypothetical protein
VAISYCQLNSELFWEPRYIAVARTRITRNTSHDCYCCVTSPQITENTCHVIPTHSCVTSCMCCIAMVHAWTQRKHFHGTGAWCVCWNVYTGLLPSNALGKSVTICSLCICSFATDKDKNYGRGLSAGISDHAVCMPQPQHAFNSYKVRYNGCFITISYICKVKKLYSNCGI